METREGVEVRAQTDRAADAATMVRYAIECTGPYQSTQYLGYKDTGLAQKEDSLGAARKFYTVGQALQYLTRGCGLIHYPRIVRVEYVPGVYTPASAGFRADKDYRGPCVVQVAYLERSASTRLGGSLYGRRYAFDIGNTTTDIGLAKVFAGRSAALQFAGEFAERATPMFGLAEISVLEYHPAEDTEGRWQVVATVGDGC